MLKKLQIFEANPSGVDCDLDHFYDFNLKCHDPFNLQHMSLTSELFLRFQIEMLRKLFEIDPG